MKILESAENYLEAIFMLGQDGKPVRSIDVVNELDFTKPSVSIAMKNLRSSGYIEIDNDGNIELTDSGREVAEAMYARHVLLSDWLIFLGVDRETAVADACRMEHGMSEKSYLALKNHIEDWKRHIYMK